MKEDDFTIEDLEKLQEIYDRELDSNPDVPSRMTAIQVLKNESDVTVACRLITACAVMHMEGADDMRLIVFVASMIGDIRTAERIRCLSKGEN